ncbi:hypothetical protein FOXB_14650 [Fusarium oxysporum f. sp. conglutinans Fo5176]|uniref:Uncharacterized protein n=1 Tax=Fusarium oxysporum (strain Fo5176) TaxID=660025 RepID=F9G7L8_FUSOF|nr:hypothetical protein FOXB_14650 [Fusarium oxysporum f. sp. conglutinans Fo5176]
MPPQPTFLVLRYRSQPTIRQADNQADGLDGGKKTRDRQAKQLSEKGVRMDIDRENFGRSLLEVVTEFDTQCTQECEAASTFLAIGVRRNDACDVSLVLIDIGLFSMRQHY